MSFHSESGILVHVEIFLLILVELVLLNRLDLPGVDGNCLLVALSALATTMQGWRSCSVDNGQNSFGASVVPGGTCDCGAPPRVRLQKCCRAPSARTGADAPSCGPKSQQLG